MAALVRQAASTAGLSAEGPRPLRVYSNAVFVLLHCYLEFL